MKKLTNRQIISILSFVMLLSIFMNIIMGFEWYKSHQKMENMEEGDSIVIDQSELPSSNQDLIDPPTDENEGEEIVQEEPITHEEVSSTNQLELQNFVVNFVTAYYSYDSYSQQPWHEVMKPYVTEDVLNMIAPDPEAKFETGVPYINEHDTTPEEYEQLLKRSQETVIERDARDVHVYIEPSSSSTYEVMARLTLRTQMDHEEQWIDEYLKVMLLQVEDLGNGFKISQLTPSL